MEKPDEDRAPIFVQVPHPPELLCCICEHLLSDPKQCKAGHLFCKECIFTWLDKQQTCPSCRAKLTKNILSDGLFVKNVIAQLPVRCPHPPCDWTGPLEKITSSHYKECPALFVKCRNAECAISVKRCEVDEHEKTCPHTKISCKDCAASFPRHAHAKHKAACPRAKVICAECTASFLRIEEAKHVNDECPERYVICDKCDNWKGSFKNLRLHYEQECPKTQFACPLCKEMFFRGEETYHIEQNMASHVFLLMKENAILRAELTEMTTPKLQELPCDDKDYHQCFSFQAPDGNASYASEPTAARVANGGPLIRFRIERLRVHDHQTFGRWIGADFPADTTRSKGHIWVKIKLFARSNPNGGAVLFEHVLANVRYDSNGAAQDASFSDDQFPGYLMPLSNSIYPNSLGPTGRLLVKYYIKFVKEN